MSDELFPPFPVPEDLALQAKEKGWPDGLLQRAVDLRYERAVIEQWLSAPATDTATLVEQLERGF